MAVSGGAMALIACFAQSCRTRWTFWQICWCASGPSSPSRSSSCRRPCCRTWRVRAKACDACWVADTQRLTCRSPAVTKKRATQCLTYIAKNSPEALFNELAEVRAIGAPFYLCLCSLQFVQALIALLRSTKAANKRTYVQALGSLARTVYHRMGKHVAAISPLLREAIQAANKEGDEDLKENVLQVSERHIAE